MSESELEKRVNDEKEGERIDGAALLDDVQAHLTRFVAYPSPSAEIAHTLWVAHTPPAFMDLWESTPRAAFLSPEPESGKTRALEITETLVVRPIEAVSATSAYLFRKISDPEGLPVILYDEIDTVFGPKAKDNEEVRGVLNAGHRRGAVSGRCVTKGKAIETEELPSYCAVALAGIGSLPDTILTRSIVIRMRRRAPTEKIESYRRRLHAKQGHILRDSLVKWADQVKGSFNDNWPEMPEGIEDRSADMWEALLVIADLAGGHWPQKARAAAKELVKQSKKSTPSLGVRLLADIHKAFGDLDRIGTTALLKALNDMPEAPWGDLRGRELDSRGLADFLGAYDIHSKKIRIGEKSIRGYKREFFVDAWKRYLPRKSGTSGTSGTEADVQGDSVPDDPERSGGNGTGKSINPAVLGDVPDVPDVPYF